MIIQMMQIGSMKSNNPFRRKPCICLSGLWLNDYGFEANTLVSATYEKGKIILKSEGKSTDTYNPFVKSVIRNHNGLFVIKKEHKNKKEIPYLSIKGYWLEEIGFFMGETIAIKIEKDEIVIKVFDPMSL